MAKKNLAELLVDTLVAAGVKRIYGLAGDSLNGITDALRYRRKNQMDSRPARRDGRICCWRGSAFDREPGGEKSSQHANSSRRSMHCHQMTKSGQLGPG
jgi:hypothetical protein